MTSIDDRMFWFCSELTTIVIGNGVTSIGEFAFHACNKLEKVYYNGTAEDWDKIDIDSSNDSYLYGFINNERLYYYSETQPTGEGNYWHDVGGEIVEW